MAEIDREKYLSDTSARLWETSKLVEAKYGNDPDGLFKQGNHTVPEIYFILRALPGIGSKKASMIARSFASHEGNWYLGVRKRLKRRGINLTISGKNLTEVPIDVHVVKVFGRLLGEFRDTPTREKFVDYVPDIQNFAKLVAADFPARLDDIFWEVGRTYCSERQPRCQDCPLRDVPCEYATS
jgi:endonuclease III